MSEFSTPDREPLSPEEKQALLNEAHDFATDWVGRGRPSQQDHERAVNFIDISTNWLTDRDFQIGGPEDLKELAELLVPVMGKERRQLEREAGTDPLTGLAHKGLFEKARGSADEDPKTSFIFIDARNFEEVNNNLGHDSGDEEIKSIADHIKSEADKYHLGTRVFRVGGDEFAVIVPSDLARYLHYQTVEKYQGISFGKNKTTSLRGVYADTFAEAAQKMVELKKAEKISKIGKIIRKFTTRGKNEPLL